MPVYDSTSAFLRQQLKNFKDASQADKVLREAAINATSAVLDRVQQQGRKSDGSSLPPYDSGRTISMASPIGKKFGEIATKKQAKAFGDRASFSSYKEFRQKLGLQTAYMDLTLTGDMFLSWMPVPISNTAYGVTFTTTEQAKVAGYLEERFGAIFELSEEELKQSLKIIERLVTKYLSR